ncbi:hypothetical protein Slin15195_G069340 [Septoria linicola]|uniref:Uncharacterized protein n=1 Tax=Septoria linicola TaxID=215465 RepID=A0A9Q9AR72_9PEZI|nr:hypothetical protein Slin14017_G102080 [Septoria linicola]USW53615.1 hypothetical protein Slin15195_G069340 [Septoria linicola]
MLAQTLTIASLAVAAFAQSTTSAPSAGEAETTITALFGTVTSGFAGSVVSANACETTLALACTATDVPLCEEIPDLTATVVLGPTAYEFIYATSTLGGIVTIAQSCDLEGPSGSFTAASCTASLDVSAAGVATATTVTTSITDSAEFMYAPIPITAGASLLPSAGASCSATADSGAAPTGVVELYKILVPVGAALAAGAGAML